MRFRFNEFYTNIIISREVPDIKEICGELNVSAGNILFIADENTLPVVKKILCSADIPVCVLQSGEENKNWQSAEKILKAAKDAGLGRDSLFIAAGGGVICDLCAFAASVYMRGCRLALIATTLLAMVDAAVGGKTGFDLFGIKNLTGTFYPAQAVYMPLESLSTLPQKEFKSGFAEIIKTAVLSGDDFLDRIADNKNKDDLLCEFIEKSVNYKASIVSEDLRESGKRMLLNLGHTFGHALESAAGLGNITHGEAVAWGMARACELGIALGITPQKRAKKIKDLIVSCDYDLACPHPYAKDIDVLLDAMKNDKKKAKKGLTFIVPDAQSASITVIESEDEYKLLRNVLEGRFT